MTGAALPAGRRHRGAGGVDRRRGARGAHRPPARRGRVRPAGRRGRRGGRHGAAKRGSHLGAAQVGLAAAVGRSRVLVRPRPRVVVVSTGSELVEPGLPLAPGRIPDSNSLALTAAAVEAGAQAYRVGIVPDDPARLLDTLEDQLVRADVLVTSGGVSVGAYDVVKEVLSRLGHGAVRQGRDAAGHAAGLRHPRAGEHAGLRAARQPGLGDGELRGVRPPGAAPDAGRAAARAARA